MNTRLLLIGLLGFVLFYIVFLLACLAVLRLLPRSGLGKQAAAALGWLPPFLRGDALREWAAATAQGIAQQQLSGTRTADTAARLAMEMEAGAMHAMLPLARSADLGRVIACPESGQGLIGVTAPEVLAIAGHVRKKLPRAEQERMRGMAAQNAKQLAARTSRERISPVLPCPLQGDAHICCVYSQRPLRCRILHSVLIANEMTERHAAVKPGEERHEETVAEGIEIGLTRALDSAGLSAKVYELNSALAIALGMPNAAERWASGEDVFSAALIQS